MLETKRLLLQDYTEANLLFLEKMLRNPNVMRFIGDGQIRNKEQAVQFLNWISEHYEINANYGLKLLIVELLSPYRPYSLIEGGDS